MSNFRCFSCGGVDSSDIYDFGNIPLVNSFHSSSEVSNLKYPLSVVVCKHCKVCQLKEVPPPEVIFTEYKHYSSASKDNVKHLENFSSLLNKMLKKESKILEVGCNDGTLMSMLDGLGYKVLGIDPARNMDVLPIHKKLNTTFQNFGLDSVEILMAKNNQTKFDCIIGLNVFAHFTSVGEAFIAVNKLLEKDGIFVFEVAYALDTIFSGIYDTVYHEHVFNHTVVGLQNMLSLANLKIVGINKINTQGGSLRVFAVKKDAQKDFFVDNDDFKTLLNIEVSKGIGEDFFANKTSDTIKNSIQSIKKITSQFLSDINEQCFLLGAPARGVVIANTCGFDLFRNLIVVDDTEEKNDKYFPGLNVKVKKWDQIESYHHVHKAILLSWNYRDTMLKKLKVNGFKGQVLCYFPEIEFINID